MIKKIFKKLTREKSITESAKQLQDLEKSKPRHKHNLQIGTKYILISNNKDNLSVGEYIGEQEYDHKRFTLSLFKDVVTKEIYFSLGKHIVFTQKRLLALSKMNYTDVIELNYHLDEEYEVNTVPTNDDYIDPMLNYEIIMKSINEEKE